MFMIHFNSVQWSIAEWNHSHKKRKDSLETLAVPAVFSLEFEFRKLLEPSLREPAWNINKKVRGTIKQFKVEGFYSRFVLNLRMPGENCFIFNWHGSRAASGISFFGVPAKDNQYCKNWIDNIVAAITLDTVMKAIEKEKLKSKYFELHYPRENMICHNLIIPTKLHFSYSNWSIGLLITIIWHY